MNDRHRAVMRARIRYERRKHERTMDEFAKALYPVFKAAAATIDNGLLPSSSGKQKARRMKGALEAD
ncbi:hypothetical protein QUD65_12845 [Lacticaseibacillus paracasei]|uniref:hypothetical protein n=1 Tax=Lacticaseibacillus paracasei TaxID=1597 RepID=UPI0025A130D4|nr:hypothetical protein [Lacticaseibacillus paracasei]MDM7550581.1 hypothetical protein [Lacticaseibacillus paracasei]